MLKVKTRLAESVIENIGLGLFADEDIAEGTVIWELVPGLDIVLTEEQFSQYNGVVALFLKKYCYKDFGNYVICIDDGRFMNHSEELCNTIETDDKTVASRFIRKGEEIFSNYANMGRDGSDRAFNLHFV